MELPHTASISLRFKLMWACEQVTNTGGSHAKLCAACQNPFVTAGCKHSLKPAE